LLPHEFSSVELIKYTISQMGAVAMRYSIFTYCTLKTFNSIKSERLITFTEC